MRKVTCDIAPLAGAIASLFLIISCSPMKGEGTGAGRVGRVVSLSPSLTRQVIDLDAGGLLVGVTSHDERRSEGIEVVGTLVQPNIEKILALEPDIVLFSGEDGPVQKMERLRQAGAPAHRFERNRGFEDICENYIALGALLGREGLARGKAAGYRERLEKLRRETEGRRVRGPLAAFFLSCRPLIAASADSFIGRILADSGGVPAYAGSGMPYPLVSLESLVAADPDVIICMTGEEDLREFRRSLADFRTMRAVAGRRIHMIDPDTVPYYTPADYVKSVETISAILKGTVEGR